MAVYTPPFRYYRRYIFDNAGHMVSDSGEALGNLGTAGAVAAHFRGEGKLSYLPEGPAIQDEIGRMMADALNEYYENRSSNNSTT